MLENLTNMGKRYLPLVASQRYDRSKKFELATNSSGVDTKSKERREAGEDFACCKA